MIRRLLAFLAVPSAAAILVAVLVVTALPSAPALAVQPDEILENPVLERRARAISKDLRCVVCQNESIDESNSELARDMRLIVRERLLLGDADSQVVEFMVDRYGDYVLLNPPFKGTTYILWFGPLVFALIAVGAGWRFYRHQAVSAARPTKPAGDAPAESTAPPPLTADEKRRLDKLLKNADGNGGAA